MASWVACPDGTFVQIAQLERVSVQPDPSGNGQWIIQGEVPGQFVTRYTLKSGFATQAAATSALTTAIANLGGSV